VHVDGFGNVGLGVTHEDLEQLGLRLGHELELRLGPSETHHARYVRTFADARRGELIVYEDASRRLAVAFNHDSAARRLGLRAGVAVRLSRADD